MQTKTYSIVLLPNFDAENPAHRSGPTRVSQRTHATREGAAAVAQGISAGGRSWASVVTTEEAARMVRAGEAALVTEAETPPAIALPQAEQDALLTVPGLPTPRMVAGLYDHLTGDYIREATAAEVEASDAGGPEGLFTGPEGRTCYTQAVWTTRPEVL